MCPFIPVIEKIVEADKALFRFINTGLYNEYAALAVKYTANDVFLAACVFAGFALMFRRFGRLEKINTAFALWAVILANLFNSKILKVIFQRQRPVVEIPETIMMVNMRYLGYAFPSTHTAMAAALAAVLWRDYPKARPFLAGFVFLMAFFCVYSGGHYPMDTAAGLVSGAAVGLVLDFLKEKFVKRRAAQE
ncbi:MAG TPA: phosphatase PAP2 family protein [Firmicutes bacterium]|nr:phosphatase PAP2 family protein [Bacillota bacterium]